MATKNVTISQALVALFNIHNVQTRWLRGLSGTYVFADENGSFPQLESFDVATVRVNSPNFTSQFVILLEVFDCTQRNYVKTGLWREMPLSDNFDAKCV